MRTSRIAAAAVLLALAGLLAPACLQSSEGNSQEAGEPNTCAAEDGNTGEAQDDIVVGHYSAAAFHFFTKLPVNPKKAPGGWQQCETDLTFQDNRHGLHQEWTCHLFVGMPLQTKLIGLITQQDAAKITADVASEAAVDVLLSRPLWLPSWFCGAFYDDMNKKFTKLAPPPGARASATDNVI